MFLKRIYPYALLVCLFSCVNNNPTIDFGDFDPETWDTCNNTEFKTGDFTIDSLDYLELPYTNSKILADDILTRERIFDEDSIPMILFAKKKIYFPTNMIQYCYGVFDQLVVTQKDTSSLFYVEKIAKKLLDMAMEVDTSLLIPYNFNFPLHGIQSGEVMIAPWYSAMAQGQALTLFSRLYNFTNKPEYLMVCRKLFNSFLKIKGNNDKPWISCVDKNGNLWFEEYPADLPGFTLNGKIFAIFGLYDYYQVTKDQEVEKILKAGIATIKANIHRFRSVGEPSFYCLKHKYCNVQYSDYHKIHIEQLNMLYEMTKDVFFLDMAKRFKDDVANEES